EGFDCGSELVYSRRERTSEQLFLWGVRPSGDPGETRSHFVGSLGKKKPEWQRLPEGPARYLGAPTAPMQHYNERHRIVRVIHRTHDDFEVFEISNFSLLYEESRCLPDSLRGTTALMLSRAVFFTQKARFL